jgi:argininosuccinate lyase
MKLWQGRFSKEIDSRTNDFNSSIKFDSRMWREDIQGSLAHAQMLAKQGIISAEDFASIKSGLAEIQAALQNGTLEIDPKAEDIHTFIEGELTRRIGDAGKRLHTGRSRNDQVATDLRLYLKTAVKGLNAQLAELVILLADKAKQHSNVIMPGYTHLQRAQPVVFGHHLLAYAQSFRRDILRFDDAAARMNECPLGSGALAGTTYPLDREFTASLLGFEKPTANSLDGVADRDFCVEILSALSLAMVHLSRFSEEIILWSSFEFGFITLDDAFSTGSSIMPQKKNPDIAELVRGKSGRVFGGLIAVLTMLKGLPLAYNKDMQEDKEAVFDALDTVTMCLTAFIPMVESMKVNAAKMRSAASAGFMNATDCADYLVSKGLPFRDAYKITGTLVALCESKKIGLEDLPLEEYKQLSQVFEADVFEAISLETCVNNRNVYGGPAPENVMRAADGVLKELTD